MKMSQVGRSKGNSVWIRFVLEPLINRKLHYRRDVSEYNVLRVKKRFPYEKRISFCKLHYDRLNLKSA